MYAEHFNFHMLPFENVPDPAFFFDEGDHARVHARIKDSLNAGRGLMVVSGPIGSGKTTLSQMIISEFSKDLKLIWIAEPPANSLDLFLFIAEELGLKPETSERTFLLRDIRDALQKIRNEGGKCLVIMDESHLVSDDTINGIRLLNNLEEGSVKLIQILLLGQEELLDIINRPEMEPFRQRISTLEIIGKMNPERIRKYISHRVHVAGGQPSIFADTGWEAVDLAFGAGSTPRVINSLCDRCLSVACEKNKTIVDVDDVYEAARDMGLSKEIFHYKIKLRDMEKAKETVPGGNGGSGEKSAGRKTEKKPVDIQLDRDISFAADEEKKGLKMPVFMFILSVIALASSIVYYCGKAQSTDLLSCLRELLVF